ncbi:helicase-related protein [Acinetobacter baumannii]|uniref:helicase-related protein n=1 Tax=Acinetobacter baumannii TaxID=470 RepID=UPI003A86ABD3
MINGAFVRDQIIFKTLQEELLGPCSYGEELDVQSGSRILIKNDTPFITKHSKEEILKVYPVQRYGVGVIYPADSDRDLINDQISSNQIEDNNIDDFIPEDIEHYSKKLSFDKKTISSDSDDFDISLANTRVPSSVGLSFLLDPNQSNQLEFIISGAFYKDFEVQYEIKKNIDKWWYRKPVLISFNKKINELESIFKFNLFVESGDSSEELLKNFYIEGIVRNYKDKLLITVALVNRSPSSTTFIAKNKHSFFQTQLRVSVSEGGKKAILPYPEAINETQEDVSNQLLYRKAPVFGKGHGVACNWDIPAYCEVDGVNSVYTEALPTFETPSISSEVITEDNGKLEISMAALAAFTLQGEGDYQLQSMIEAYEKWIRKNTELIDETILDSNLKIRAHEHIQNCKLTLERIKAGYLLICNNMDVQRAFKLTNKAMLEQQKHAPKTIRTISFNKGYPVVETPYMSNINIKGIWRPFQIGFLLMCIQGAIDKSHADHDKVDLIWFPTGGGKTEAYLALAAFTLILGRIKDGENADGVQVLMRYTLRLLTAQQLQRAATLICCLEVIRQEENLPGKAFSIGLWVGGKNTPNTRDNALKAFRKLKNGVEAGKTYNNPFLLDRCPYCATQLGIVSTQNHRKTVVGYKVDRHSETIIFSCVDQNCKFSQKIPIFLIDEDIYFERPSIVIATVDKFAMLAWQPKIRSIFGINEKGRRFSLPPQLIIQDELHLISGPLGSMVALYEPLIEELCSDSLDGSFTKPKIVCATATTKGYQEQIKSIYGRQDISIFPPAGIDAEDSFFARYARDKEGKLLPGRKYVGVCAPGLGSVLTTQVRTHSALLLAANRVEVEERDPWVTLLSFYNSIRELGGAITLFQSDIVSYLLEQKRRYPRWILPRRNIQERGMELTSRLKDDEIPKAIVALEKKVETLELDTKFYKSLVLELKEIEKINPEFSESTSHLINCIELNQKINLESYIHFEKISAGLKIKNSKYKLPKNFRKFYSLCLNSNVQAFCLASSIIEVGVDIDRLSVMSIIGQPKTTAQYIQVSGRVGRKNEERPGLVVSIYNNSKPRDKSHYEDFRGYHQRLYARVEPSTVTPFSRPALKRGLGAIIIANIRQFSHLEARPGEIDKAVIQNWINRFLELRKHTMSEDEYNDINKFFKSFVDKWDRKKVVYNDWGQLKIDSEPKLNDLLFPLGIAGKRDNKIPCPTSMRNVDAESSLWITDVYEQNHLNMEDWDDE